MHRLKPASLMLKTSHKPHTRDHVTPRTAIFRYCMLDRDVDVDIPKISLTWKSQDGQPIFSQKSSHGGIASGCFSLGIENTWVERVLVS